MQNCPVCGTRLSVSLVESITDKNQPESCPDRRYFDFTVEMPLSDIFDFLDFLKGVKHGAYSEV